MGKMIQIRNVPEEMHVELKRRAKREGLTLSDFLKRELVYILETKSLAEIFEEMEPYRVDRVPACLVIRPDGTFHSRIGLQTAEDMEQLVRAAQRPGRSPASRATGP